MSSYIGYLYINGLGDGATTLKDKVVKWWWKRAGLDIRHAHINWYDDKDLNSKLKSVENKVNELLKEFSAVTIIGCSAGGSLAVNSFYRLRDKNVCVVSAHARLKSGKYPDGHRMSLRRRAHVGSNKQSRSFYNSVVMAEIDLIPKFNNQDKRRLLTLSQLTDLVVPIELMKIDGVRQHRSLAFGHSGGFLAHLIADRNLIVRFAESRLL